MIRLAFAFRCLLLLLPLARTIGAQETAPRTPAERAQWDSVARAEDARASTPEEMATLRTALQSPSPAIRRLAARALGRFERDSLLRDLTPLLGDSAPMVRAMAAQAMAQASVHAGAPVARAALLARVPDERDVTARAALAEALGRLPQGDTATARATAETLAAMSRSMSDASRDPSSAMMYGVARGFYALARQPAARFAIAPSAGARLIQLLAYGRTTSSDSARTREIRELVAGTLVGTRVASEATLLAILTDPDAEVRRRAIPAILTVPDTALARRVALRAMFDPAPNVRMLAIPAYAQRFAAERECAPFLTSARDPDLGVRLAAVDALGGGCPAGSPAAGFLDALTALLPAPNGSDAGAWHLPAHALVALAGVAPAQARATGRIATFAASPSVFVREYAARAAARARDTATLRRLVTDAHPNVRTSAVAGLAEVIGHAGDAAYLAALRTDDNQVVMTAAQALAKSRDGAAVPALLDALDRISAPRQETWRDARIAVLDRLRELGESSRAARLRPYLADFDTAVATHAADVLGTWTGTRPTPAPAPLVRAAVPSGATLEALARTQVVLQMADGGTIVVRLYPYDAPSNVARFARLAREGKLDGLTFHRVVPARLIQGGSPGANEYAGWGTFSRDEIWRTNRRGTVGLSTRGRDTGDGQVYVNIADNFDFDYNYTVYGDVIAGMNVVDRMQEGAVIRKAMVVGPRMP